LVRAGEESLHRNWLRRAGADRTWDLVVSWYGEADYQPVADERLLRRKGAKWDIVQEHLRECPELLEGYDFTWFPDDDIDTDAATIEQIFAEMAAWNLSVGQPGLSANSYFSHIYTLRLPSLRLRYSSTIECMMPCIAQPVVRQMLPYLGVSRSGYGLDGIWTRLAVDNRYRAAVLDSVEVRHTRPVGQFLAVRLKAEGISMLAEARTVARVFHWSRRREFPCYGGITHSGRRVGLWGVALRMALNCLTSGPRWVEPEGWRAFRRSFRFAYRTPDLKQLVPASLPEPKESTRS
jgi:hypothetical protein